MVALYKPPPGTASPSLRGQRGDVPCPGPHGQGAVSAPWTAPPPETVALSTTCSDARPVTALNIPHLPENLWAPEACGLGTRKQPGVKLRSAMGKT